MTIPKLSIALFPPKTGGKKYVGVGSLALTVDEAQSLANWLMGQKGEFDDYKQENLIRLVAFKYENTSKAGKQYETVSLVDPSGFGGGNSNDEMPF